MALKYKYMTGPGSGKPLSISIHAFIPHMLLLNKDHPLNTGSITFPEYTSFMLSKLCPELLWKSNVRKGLDLRTQAFGQSRQERPRET